MIISSGVLLCDVKVPYLWIDVTDRHLITLLHTMKSYLALTSLFTHPLTPPSLSLSPVTHSLSPSLYHVAYCRIHTVYFLLSLESNTFISFCFQRTPLRLRLPPFLHYTASIDEYIRHCVNALIPSFLLQSPVFVGALDLIGNPGNVMVSLYHSLTGIVLNPLHTLRNGEGFLSFWESLTTSSLSLLQTIVGGILSSISSISANLSRNIRKLTGDEDGRNHDGI